MNRDDAVEKIRGAGFNAFKRDWGMGETVGCGEPVDEPGEITRYDTMVYLFPTSSGWGIQALGILRGTDYSQSLTLEDACDLAIGILSCPHLPIRPKDLEITSARCVGGDGSWIQHSPTGVRRTLFMPEDGRRRDFMTKDQAFREIVFELARDHTSTEQVVDVQQATRREPKAP